MPETPQKTPEESAFGRHRASGKWLFLLALCVTILTISGEVKFGDGVAILEVTESIVDRGTIKVARDFSWFDTNPGYSYFSSGLSFLATPFYLAGKLASRFFDESAKWPIIELFSTFTNAVLSALIVLIFFKFVLLITGLEKQSILATLILMLSTMLWYRSKVFLREPASTFFLLQCVYLLYLNGRTPKRAYLFGAGFSFLIMVWTRFEMWVLMPFLAGYLAACQDCKARQVKTTLKRILAFSAIPLLSLPVFMYFNLLKFGDPMRFGYPGLSLTATPLWLGLEGLLASPMHGLLIHSLPVVIGLFGFSELLRRDRPLAVFLISISLFLVIFYAKYSIWTGAFSIGPRFLLPIVPLLMIPAVFVVDLQKLKGWKAALLILVVAFGFIVQVLSVCGNWQVFFERYVDFFGKEGQFHTPVRFLRLPLVTFFRQIQFGDIHLIWLNFSKYGIPGFFYFIPVACLAGVGISAAMLHRRIRTAGGIFAGLRTFSGKQKRILAALCAGAFIFCAILAGQRLIVKRGLDLMLFSSLEGNSSPDKTLEGQMLLVDSSHNPMTRMDKKTKLAVWRGFLRIPSYYFTNRLFLSTDGKCDLIIGDKKVFSIKETRPGQLTNAQLKFDLPKGYYPLTAFFHPENDDPYLSFRWSIQDFAYKETIGKGFYFSKKPGRLGAFLVEMEFYLILAAVIFIYLALGYALECRLRNDDGRGPRG